MNAIQRALAVYANKAEYQWVDMVMIRYEHLRRMTALTTIDVANQARDYISEFYRLRRCILPSVQIPFFFPLSRLQPYHEVLLVGDFTNWLQNPIPMEKGKDGFFISIPLPKGDYHYK